MVIASVNENLVPLAATIHEDDGSGRAAAETAERALLYVAATRAKKDVTVSELRDAKPVPDLTTLARTREEGIIYPSASPTTMVMTSS